MLHQFSSKYLIFLILVPIVKARFHKYSLANTSSVRYTDFLAYYEDTSTLQCLALCDGQDSCTSINYNLDTERCELTPHLPRIQSPDSANRIIPVIDAWQVSTFNSTHGPMSANYAIDGNRDNNDKNGWPFQCAHTERWDSNTYWAMEFECVAKVEYVIIYFRNRDVYNYRNQNLRLLISKTRQDSDNNIGTDCATFAGPPASPSLPVTIMCTQLVEGKFLKIIQNINTGYFSLCEVEVYSV